MIIGRAGSIAEYAMLRWLKERNPFPLKMRQKRV